MRAFEVPRGAFFADMHDGKLFTCLWSGMKKGNINSDTYELPEGEPPKAESP